MNELSGWKQIADFLSISERTALRWEKDRNMPVHRIGEKGRVYAYENELLEWKNSISNGNGNSENLIKLKDKNNKSIEKKEFGSKKNFTYLLSTLAFLVFCIAVGIKYFNKDYLDNLYITYKNVGTQNFINVYDNLNKKKLLSFKINFAKPCSVESNVNTWGLNFLKLCDFNNDGLTDIVYLDLNNNVKEKLKVFKRVNKEEFEKVLSLNINSEFSYLGEQFSNFRPISVEVADLNYDGKFEIIVNQIHIPYYPSVTKVFSIKGEKIIEIWHPGHLTNIKVSDRDKNNRKEIYIGGTCNFLSEYSSPVFYVFECDWNKKNQYFSLFGENRKIVSKTPEDISVYYVNLKKNNLMKKKILWEKSTIFNINENSKIEYLSVGASIITNKEIN